MIGRQVELAELEELLAGGRSVAICGEPGVGKTTLLRALADRAGRRVFTGGGLAQLRNEPYLPLQRALGVRVRGGDPVAVAEFVAIVVGDGLLVLDDLHLADGPTLAALEALAGDVHLLGALRTGEPLSEPVAAALASAGVEVRDLVGLEPAAAAALARACEPQIEEQRLERVLSAAGGNPLFIEQLARTGLPSRSLAQAIDARLASCSAGARRGLALLALRGQPCPHELIGADAVAELLGRGLADCTEESIVLRHGAVGERALDALAASERARLHAELAGVLGDPGERALHLAAAGLRLQAKDSALLAARACASAPAARARHLALAAACGEGPEALTNACLAAESFLAAGEPASAAALAEQALGRAAPRQALEDPPGWAPPARSAHGRTPQGGWPRTAARAYGLLARAHLALDEPARAARAAAEGLALADDPADDLQLRIALLLADGGSLAPAARLTEAERCREHACRLGCHEAMAFVALGSTQLSLGDQRWRATLAEAVRLARRQGDAQGEMLAGHALVLTALAHAPDLSLPPLVAELEQRATALALGGWEVQFALARLWLALCEGVGLDEVERECRHRLSSGIARPWHPQIEALLALSLADRGASGLAEARRRLARTPVPAQASLLAWVRAEVEWLAGAERAVELAAACARDHALSAPVGTLARVTLAWAESELGAEQGAAGSGPSEPAHLDAYGGALAELAALRALAGARSPEVAPGTWGEHGSAEQAAAHFLGAQDDWRGVALRGELRSMFGHALALTAAGTREDAAQKLRALAQRVGEGELGLLDSRIARALRELGMRGGFGASADATGLTAAERAVLALAASGMTNAEIARFLHVAPATVETHVEHAREKLGASTRKQAVARFVRGRELEREQPTTRLGEAERGDPSARAPIVLVHDRGALAEAAGALRAEGWVLRDGFPVDDGWAAERQRVVFVGSVDEPHQRRAAVRAGALGAGLAIIEPPADSELAEDLARLGEVTVYERGSLTPRMRALLQALSAGLTLKAAARELHLSERAAYRAMAAARELLGVTTNVQALAEYARGRGSGR